jgi:FtsP/CotA-like multicopper oxidase with cupredoxin domain
LIGGLSAGLLAGCTEADATMSGHSTGGGPTPPARTVPTAAPAVERTLIAAPATIDLGGPQVKTWAYDGSVPGPELRAKAGDRVRFVIDNQLPAETTIHWHGIALENGADGVPGMTQDPVKPGSSYTYDFTVPDPGTYWLHPHVGTQLDRGLYAPLIVDDPAEPGRYDAEWVVVLDDWLDGTGRTPDDVLRELTRAGTGGGMGHMDHSTMGDPPFGAGGDVIYPHYLINGAIPESPRTFQAKPGQRLRIRLINAASDTIFMVAVGSHRLTVTHSDGFGVQPQEVDALYVGMGERYDVVVTLGDGVFPLVAKPWAKAGQALALIRTAIGSAPSPDVALPEFTRTVTQGVHLKPAESSLLPMRSVDVVSPLNLGGQMSPYVWTINGAPYGKNKPIEVRQGQRLRLDVGNHSMMTHPVHIHGHTFAMASGLRKDTVLIPPMGAASLQLEAVNPGAWMVHCHNTYHAEAGMMIGLHYR